MDYKKLTEEYVRKECDLEFLSATPIGDPYLDSLEIHLEHWLRVLDLNSTDKNTHIRVSANFMRVEIGIEIDIMFSLDRGEPNREEDYKALWELLINDK